MRALKTNPKLSFTLASTNVVIANVSNLLLLENCIATSVSVRTPPFWVIANTR
jgi:hypothetical protein